MLFTTTSLTPRQRLRVNYGEVLGSDASSSSIFNFANDRGQQKKTFLVGNTR